MSLLAGYFCIFLVGLVLGLLGGGGSILSVPVLVYLFGMAASQATVYSLFLVGISSLIGTFSYLPKKLVDFKVGLFFLFPSMIGVAIARRWLLPALPDLFFQLNSFALTKDRLILLVFGLVMGLASYSMLRARRTGSNQVESTTPRLALISICGFAAGAVMGFVGAGGGFLIIPVLVSLGSVEMKRAIGTSLFIITASSLFGFGSDWLAGVLIDWKLLGVLSPLSISGVVIGSRLSGRVPSSLLKRAFGVMILVIALALITKELFFSSVG